MNIIYGSLIFLYSFESTHRAASNGRATQFGVRDIKKIKTSKRWVNDLNNECRLVTSSLPVMSRVMTLFRYAMMMRARFPSQPFPTVLCWGCSFVVLLKNPKYLHSWNPWAALVDAMKSPRARWFRHSLSRWEFTARFNIKSHFSSSRPAHWAASQTQTSSKFNSHQVLSAFLRYERFSQ